MKEIWKDIPWMELKYQASSIGRIRRIPHYTESKKWINQRFKPWMILKQVASTQWYLMCSLWRVHRLVCMAFHENNKEKRTVNHIDWVVTNNKIENLEWATLSENIKHSYDFLWKQKNIPPNSEKQVAQYDLDGILIAEYKSINEAVRKTWIIKQCITPACKGISKTAWWFIWKYL